MSMQIDQGRLRDILEIYGADPARWPDAERAAMLAHLRRSSDVTSALEAAGALDDLLAFSTVPEPSANLEQSVLRAAPRPRMTRRLRLWWAALLLAAATGGVAAGTAASAAFAPAELPGYGRADATAFGAVLDAPAQETGQEAIE